MSQSTSTGETAKAPEVVKQPPTWTNFTKACAIFAGDLSGPVFAAASETFGPTKVQARLCVQRKGLTSPFLGFRLDFPLGEKQVANEDSGFGVHYGCKLTACGDEDEDGDEDGDKLCSPSRTNDFTDAEMTDNVKQID